MAPPGAFAPATLGSDWRRQWRQGAALSGGAGSRGGSTTEPVEQVWRQEDGANTGRQPAEGASRCKSHFGFAGARVGARCPSADGASSPEALGRRTTSVKGLLSGTPEAPRVLV